MYSYDFARLNTLLTTLLEKNIPASASAWLQSQSRSSNQDTDLSKFNVAFVAMPRKTGKNLIVVSREEEDELKRLRNGWNFKGWTADRLARVWLLMQLQPNNQEQYHAAIENLFLSAEMGELVALYSSLPLLAHPESWRKRCAEGIRSNIGQVLESVICNNPFPSEQLDEAAWNQLVLKAIFTEKPILEIIGLRKRANLNLARSLSDYAHERWAAHRDVNPLLWICVAPFLDESNFSDIKRLILSPDPVEREAAALVCAETSFGPAKALLDENRELKKAVETKATGWEKLVIRN